MGEKGCSDQIRHGAELSWGEALKEELIVHWLLWTELKGHVRTLGCVFPIEACRSQIIYQSLLTLSKTRSLGGERGSSATGATWRCFNLHPLQATCGSTPQLTLMMVHSVWLPTTPPQHDVSKIFITQTYKDFLSLFPPVAELFPVTHVTGKAQLWRKVFIVWSWAFST